MPTAVYKRSIDKYFARSAAQDNILPATKKSKKRGNNDIYEEITPIAKKKQNHQQFLLGLAKASHIQNEYEHDISPSKQIHRYVDNYLSSLEKYYIWSISNNSDLSEKEKKLLLQDSCIALFHKHVNRFDNLDAKTSYPVQVRETIKQIKANSAQLAWQIIASRITNANSQISSHYHKSSSKIWLNSSDSPENWSELRYNAKKLQAGFKPILSFDLLRDGTVLIRTKKVIGRGSFKKVKLGYRINLKGNIDQVALTGINPKAISAKSSRRAKLSVESVTQQFIEENYFSNKIKSSRILSKQEKKNLVTLNHFSNRPGLKYQKIVSNLPLINPISKEFNSSELTDLISNGCFKKYRNKYQLKIFLSMAKAVRSCHKLNIIHSDIKPSNFLVSKNTKGNFEANLIDFGVAHEIKKNGNIEGSIGGTPIFMAPEKTELVANIYKASDVFELAMTIACCLGLLDKVPYKKEDEQSYPLGFADTYSSKVAAFRHAIGVKGYPGELSMLLVMMLQKSAYRRPYSENVEYWFNRMSGFC